MNFVWVPSISRYRRTEGEVKKEKLAYEVVDIETDKDSLIARFNGYEERIEALEAEVRSCEGTLAYTVPMPDQEQLRGGSPPESPPTAELVVETPELAPDPAPKLAPPPPTPSPPAITVQRVEEFILDHATPGQVENIFACLGTRFRELLKQVRVDD